MNRLVVLLSIILFPLVLSAREYAIPRVSIQAEIREDGVIRYIEERNYRFDGEYSYAYYTLPLDGFEAIENIRVRLDGQALINDNSEAPGTFKVEQRDEEIRITWFFEASGISEHLFTIQYDLTGALITGPEVTEWFWIFLSDRLDRTPDRFQARISLPEAIAEDDWHIWLRETPDHVEQRIEGDLLYLEGENLGSSDRVLARILFPTRILTEAGITDRRFGLERVMEDEAAWVEARKRERQLYLLGMGLKIVLIPASLILFIWFYRRYGRRHDIRSDARRIQYTPPSDHPPALIRMLMLGPLNSDPDKLSLGITLFDLARRGYFRIVEKKGGKRFLSSGTPCYHLEKTGKKPDDDLHEWELNLLEKVNKRVDEDVNRMDKVLDWTDKPVRKWWKSWRKLLKKSFREQKWFDPQSTKVMMFHFLAQLPIALAMIAITFLTGPVGLIGIFFMFIMLGLSLTLAKRTEAGEELHARWRAYRKALKKGPNSSFRQQDIGRHFVYAIALGLTKKQLEKRLSSVSPESPVFMWVVPLSGASSPAEMASGLSTLASSGTSSFSGMSKAGGAGVGSSGGGSGGGAG